MEHNLETNIEPNTEETTVEEKGKRKCGNCGKGGHYKSTCKEPKKEGLETKPEETEEYEGPSLKQIKDLLEDIGANKELEPYVAGIRDAIVWVLGEAPLGSFDEEFFEHLAKRKAEMRLAVNDYGDPDEDDEDEDDDEFEEGDVEIDED